MISGFLDVSIPLKPFIFIFGGSRIPKKIKRNHCLFVRKYYFHKELLGVFHEMSRYRRTLSPFEASAMPNFGQRLPSKGGHKLHNGIPLF